MSIILKGQASWYTAQDKGGNANVAMMSARTCFKCGGCGYINIECGCGSIEQCTALNEKCLRCGGDGILTNQMPFNPMGMECAMPLSLIEKHGLRFGQLVKVKYVKNSVDNFQNREITVRLVDIGPNEKLCAEGRIIDLTPFAFEQLAKVSEGLIDIEIEIL